MDQQDPAVCLQVLPGSTAQDALGWFRHCGSRAAETATKTQQRETPLLGTPANSPGQLERGSPPSLFSSLQAGHRESDQRRTGPDSAGAAEQATLWGQGQMILRNPNTGGPTRSPAPRRSVDDKVCGPCPRQGANGTNFVPGQADVSLRYAPLFVPE